MKTSLELQNEIEKLHNKREVIRKAYKKAKKVCYHEAEELKDEFHDISDKIKDLKIKEIIHRNNGF